MSSQTTYLITGANRGIGFALVKAFLARPSTTVVAAARSPTSASAAFASLPVGKDSHLIIVKIDSASDADAKTAVEELKSTHGIETLDVVVANAGIATHFGNLMDVSAGQVEEHLQVNTLGPLRLFHATQPLLARSQNRPRFLLLGSMQGSVGGMEDYPLPMGAYGASKAAAHYLVRKMHFEHEEEGLCVWAADPGFVQTDMGNTGARWFGMEQAETPVEDAARFLVEQIDSATREKVSGQFPSIEGGAIVW